MIEAVRPKVATILCPFCPFKPTPTILKVDLNEDHASCSKCSRRIRIISRAVLRVDTLRVDPKHTKYTLTVREPSGRARPRVIDAQPGLIIRANTWVTLVYKNDRVFGVADQTARSWMLLHRIEKRKTVGTQLLKFLGYVCLMLAALQTASLFDKGHSLIASAGLKNVLIVSVASVLVMLMPAFLWLIRAGYDTGDGVDFRKRQLPRW